MNLITTTRDHRITLSASCNSDDQTSYAYKLPAPATLAVQDEAKVTKRIAEERLEHIPQLGQTACLPRLHGATSHTKVVLDPSTGELKSLELTRAPADWTKAMEAGGGAINAVVDAARGKSKQEQLDEEKALLETMVAIEKARAELGE